MGPDRKLMIDANQVWEVDQAIDWVNALQRFKPYFIEEPTSPDDIEGHRKIREAVAPVKVATGEMCQNRILFKQFITRGAIDIVQIDACRIGGLNEVLSVLLMAAKYGLPVWPHAGGVGLCEYVQHLSMIDYHRRERHEGRAGDRICRPSARAFRRALRDPQRGVHAAETAGLFDRDEAGVDRGEPVQGVGRGVAWPFGHSPHGLLTSNRSTGSICPDGTARSPSPRPSPQGGEGEEG